MYNQLIESSSSEELDPLRHVETRTEHSQDRIKRIEQDETGTLKESSLEELDYIKHIKIREEAGGMRRSIVVIKIQSNCTLLFTMHPMSLST
jgi:hypothetical protein